MCTCVTALTTLTTLEIKLSTKISKRHIYFCYFFAVPSFVNGLYTPLGSIVLIPPSVPPFRGGLKPR